MNKIVNTLLLILFILALVGLCASIGALISSIMAVIS
jgi:hypothetical protein